VTQIEYYTERVKRMVGKVLTSNGITRYDQGAYDLVGGEELSDAEGEELLQLCRQRLDAFREQRGEEAFAHRSRHRTPISGSLKYRVLTRAKGRCECCGAGCCLANPAPTGPGGGPHRAHVPGRFGRPQQPAGPLLPLQCRQARCSLPTQEGTTDFRGLQASYAHRQDGCVFCALEASGRLLLENALEAVHRRCLSGDAWAQPGDPAAAWG
jgi:hypothetical protein